MIFFLADGRFGNQIFQYVFLKTIQKSGENIIASGFEELKEIFEVDDIKNINKNNIWVKRVLYKIFKPFFYFLCSAKVISCISVKHEKVLKQYRREATEVNITNGILPNIRFLKLGFFQSEQFFYNDVVTNLKVKKKYIKEADHFLFNIKNSYKVFVHIRRGDYKNYTVYGKSTLLPLKYYKEQINWFINNRDNPFFIFLSDEPDFIESEFSYIKNKIVSKNKHFGVDFAIMIKCNGAILSPSSFGWWGSYLMKERDKVFVPKYWLGFNSKIDYHKDSTPSFAQEIEL